MPSQVSAVIDLFSNVYNCLAGLAVGKPVYLSASDTVALADGTDPTKMPVIGFVHDKPTPTTCIVQYAGEFDGLSGLTVDTTYYVGAAGALVASPAGLAVPQAVGIARDATTLVLVMINLSSSGGSGGLVTPVRLPMLDGRNSNGTVMDATGGAGKLSIVNTIGTVLKLLGESCPLSSTKTDVSVWELRLPAAYFAGTNLSVNVNALHLEVGGTTLTNTVAIAAYKLGDNGAESANLVATVAAAISGVAADYLQTITGTTLNPGDRLLLVLTSVATEAGGTGTTQNTVNSIRVN